MKDIIIFGVQGAGKSTLANFILQKNQNYSHFEMGNILRTLKSTNNVLGNYVKNIIDNGSFVHYSFVNALFEAYIITLKNDELMLLDGYPRRLGELYTFLDQMQRGKRNFVAVYLDIPTQVAIDRISSRRICPKCGAIYNVNQGVVACSKCLCDLIQRVDDQPQAIKKRIDLFMEETMPVISNFEKNGNLIKIDATKPIDQVFDDFLKFVSL